MDDWRLQGQEKYLRGAVLSFKSYSCQSAKWDHEHCEFCQVKITENCKTDTICKGYATLDNYRWICEKCFHDFKDLFEWIVT